MLVIRHLVAKYIFSLLLIGQLIGGGSYVFAQDKWQSEQSEIRRLLNIDRFLFYKQAWVDNLYKKKPKSLLALIDAINVEQILKLGPAYDKKLEDVQQYDQILFELVSQKNEIPGLTPDDLVWNYNFYRNKIAEAFLLKNDSASKGLPGFQSDLVISTNPQASVELTWSPDSEIQLDVEQYVSYRTTRAVFWDIILNKRGIEFHYGTERAFRTRLQARAGIVLGEIKTRARNYNKIFLIKYPDQDELVYAFNRISGRDRLDHLIKQLSLIKVHGKSASDVLGQKISVFGDGERMDAQIEQQLTSLLERLPKADLVVIGQKSFIQGVFKGAYSADIISQLVSKHPEVVESTLGVNEFTKLQKILTKYKSQPLADLRVLPALEKYGQILKEKLILHLGVQSGDEVFFDVDNISHEVSDYILKTSTGDQQRWRLISNVWGDEVLPIGRALIRTGHRNVISIGTAGALKNSGLAVGNLVQAKKYFDDEKRSLVDFEGGLFKIPSAIAVNVGHVSTPYFETKNWLENNQNNFDVVELETAYLAALFKGQIDYQSFLLVSDVVGSANESLAAAGTNMRTKPLHMLLESIFAQSAIVGVAPRRAGGSNLVEPEHTEIYRKFKARAPQRSIESLYQVTQLAIKTRQTTDNEIDQLLKSEKPFSRDYLNLRLNQLGQAIITAIHKADGKGLQIYLPSDFMNGSWHPAQSLMVYIQVDSSELSAELSSQFNALVLQYPILKKHLTFNIATTRPDSRWQGGAIMTPASNHFLTDLYADLALRLGGLYASVNTSGVMRAKRIEDVFVHNHCATLLMAN